MSKRIWLVTTLIFLSLMFARAGLAQESGSGIETDPLAWINTPLTCAQLTDQVKSRYAPLGKFSDLPPEKKDELRKVLEAVCSARFAHCKFKNCEKDTPSSGDPASQASEAELREKASAQLRSLISENERSRRARLEESRKKGAQNNWGRISVPEDKRVTEEEDNAREEANPKKSKRKQNSSRQTGESGSGSGEPPPLIR